MHAPGRLVLVLGMHRSGTSALARGLRVLGVALGDDLLPAPPCSPKGFFEDAGLYVFNKALLTRRNLTWQSSQTPDAKVLHALAARLFAALRPTADEADGRTVRVWPAWRRLCGAKRRP